MTIFTSHLPVKTSAFIIAAVVTLVATPALAQGSDTPEEINAVYSCKSIVDDTARLTCFDEAVGRLETAEKSGDLVAISRSDVAEIEKDSFGFLSSATKGLGKLFGGGDDDDDNDEKSEKKNKLGTGGLKSVEAGLSSYSRFGRGQMRFVLDNGQVWEQTDSEQLPNIKNYKGEPNTVRVKKASLGSYLLRVNDKGRSVRVRRVK